MFEAERRVQEQSLGAERQRPYFSAALAMVFLLIPVNRAS